jgi:mRNA interferase RelE/StbE
LVWTIKLSDEAKRELSKLDKSVQKRILSFLQKRIQATGNPRSSGKALQGKLSGLWRYRVGDYRLLCRIEDDALIVLVISIGHRKEIYRER